MNSRARTLAALAATWLACFSFPALAADAPTLGYYRSPAVHGESVVFTAEGDLWRVPLAGGVAQRLTSHTGEESRAAISPDGKWIAFSASYDGPVEVYVMPFAGGLPRRLTWEGLRANVAGWTPQGEVLYATRRGSTLPATQLCRVDPKTGRRQPIPLAQAAEGAYDGGTLVFTRFDQNISFTKRYRGGTMQQLWTWSGSGEARPLMPGDSAVSKDPMVWKDRIYFIADRDQVMNLWSVRKDGTDARPLTHHRDFDVQSASLDGGRIVYQLGADLRVFDVERGTDAALPVTLASDYDQTRERWLKSPMEYASTVHASPDGDRVAITARGQVYVMPAKSGRRVIATHVPGVRWRQARFLDAKTLVALSDESGEVEFWKLPANGVGEPAALTRGAKVLRWDGVPSPDGRWLAHYNKDQELWLLEVATGKDDRIAVSEQWGDFQDLTWSSDSRWLAYVRPAGTWMSQIGLYDVQRRAHTIVTSERWDSYSPAFSPDGKWLWFLSDRTFRSVVPSIWGSRQPDPFFDRQTKIYGLALHRSFRSPFEPADELHPAGDDAGSKDSKEAKDKDAGKAAKTAKPAASTVAIDLDGIETRLIETPVAAGNLGNLLTDGKNLFWLEADTTPERNLALRAIAIGRDGDDPVTVMKEVRSVELTSDRKKLLVRKGDALYVIDAAAKAPSELDKAKVDLADWSVPFDPRIEWRQMFTEAWRLERDYFYDRKMHGVDWKAMLAKYRPLAERVTDRGELSDVFGQMMGELSALHTYVYGGDARKGADQAEPGTLGAVLERDESAGGYRIVHRYETDPDQPDKLGPLARPGLDVREGDVIQAINGVATLSVVDPAALLRNQADKQVLFRVARSGGEARDVIVQPASQAKETDLRYTAWEYERRRRVDRLSNGRIGYVHLRAMGPNDMAQWERDYFPVFQREGLIIDVRNNRGGNIDSWILGKLLRRAWMYWQPRVGHPVANMPFAFQGKIAVIVNENTISDGEAFAEGFRRLGLGKVVGVRTWGGEIWLSSDNFLVDRGIATAAETGVYAPEGVWLIEGHGVDPDIVVDNPPHATFEGEDAQLDATVKHLLEEIGRVPVHVPAAPAYPVKAASR